MIQLNKLILLCLFFMIGKGLFAQNTEWLFHGQSLSKWEAYTEGHERTADAESLFPIHHHRIVMEGKSAGYLITKESYSNFELTAHFKWDNSPKAVRKSQRQNSGIMYLVNGDAPDQLWPSGYQFQIKPGHCGDFILLGQTTLNINGLKQGPGRSVVVAHYNHPPVHQHGWNTVKVRITNGHIEQFLNGTLVNEGTNPSAKKGRILLQYEGYPIYFKNIKLTTF